MKDFNKDIFKDSVRRKFSDAEVQPSNNVWDGIEAELLKQDNKKMKKRAVFYRNLAASVILIALTSLYFNLQDFKLGDDLQSSASTPDSEILNTEGNSVPKRLGESKRLRTFRKKPEVNKRDNEIYTSDTIDYPMSKNAEHAKPVSHDEISLRKAVVLSDNEIATSPNSDYDALSKIEKLKPIDQKLPLADIQIKGVSYFAVSDLDSEKEKSSVAWNTNLNLGSGNFNPNSEITETPVFSTVSTLNSPGTNARQLDNSAVPESQERQAVESLSSEPMESNISFTIGFNFGVVLNEKWSVKSGLQYGSYRSSSSSSTVLRDRNSDELFPYHGASSSTEVSDGRVINVISEYELYNDFQIVSIPLMVSYKFIDRKFGVSLVGGLSADYIINNKVKGGSDQLNEINFSKNDPQSYKRLFASSMVGIEISYPFADKYAISIMPTYKKALSNVTNKAATFDSVPAFMGLNMSLAYMF